MQAGREWIWISGNHDPSPKNLGGSFLHSLKIEKLTFQHIASAGKALKYPAIIILKLGLLLRANLSQSVVF